MRDLKDDLLVKRFGREIRLLQNLIHVNVVRCIETGIDDEGKPYLVTEFVPDGCLEDELLENGGRLSPTYTANLICQVLDGLEYIHTHSIIHRDIKPQNILLRRHHKKGGSGHLTPKLADFGLAVSYARAGGTRYTKPKTGMGTLMFMPPEQVQSAREVREPADIYAVGSTLYYLLTGQYSFDFPTPPEILEFQKKGLGKFKTPQEALRALMQLRRIMHPFQIILSENPVPIRQRDSSIPRELAEVVDRAVRKDAGARFQSAAEFRNALRRVMR
ncbi:MAG: serine/threonine protein kinase [Blastocatellia bacterium]|nr:serine/threonine protein kinase [Blastocatellia bacterium]